MEFKYILEGYYPMNVLYEQGYKNLYCRKGVWEESFMNKKDQKSMISLNNER